MMYGLLIGVIMASVWCGMQVVVNYPASTDARLLTMLNTKKGRRCVIACQVRHVYGCLSLTQHGVGEIFGSIKVCAVV